MSKKIKFKTAETAKCTYHLKSDMDKSPHYHKKGSYEQCSGKVAKIYDTILENIGNTPMVRLNKITKEYGIKCELLAKCEFFNAGGSVKDRIGLRMIEDAERQGRIKPGDTLIEPTSGNTGIGLALAAAIKGYKMIITLPEKMSNEKVYTLKALGAKIYRTPTEAAFDSPESHIGLAIRLQKEIKNSHILDQYSNPSNPIAHYDHTGEEILKQCNNKIDMVVCTAGTGGTITGVAAKIKTKCPDCIVVGVDPHGSILAQPDTLNGAIKSYQVEGIGYDFVPQVLQRDKGLINKWVKTNDKESFLMSRKLIKEEGLLCGGSSGSAVVGALKACKSLKKGQRCVVLLPDSIRNYMTKFLSDDWMIDHGFLDEDACEADDADEQWWSNKTIGNLVLQEPITVSQDVNVKNALLLMNQKGVDQLPIVETQSGKVIGVVTIGNLTSKLVKNRCRGTDLVASVAYKGFKCVNLSTKLSTLSRLFNAHAFVLVVSKQQLYNNNNQVNQKLMVIGVLTRIDLSNFILHNAPMTPSASKTPNNDEQKMDFDITTNID